LFPKASRTWSGHTEVPLEIVPLENRSVDKSCQVPYNGPADAGESAKTTDRGRRRYLERLAGALWVLGKAEILKVRM
jgi:hypothetical protein